MRRSWTTVLAALLAALLLVGTSVAQDDDWGLTPEEAAEIEAAERAYMEQQREYEESLKGYASDRAAEAPPAEEDWEDNAAPPVEPYEDEEEEEEEQGYAGLDRRVEEEEEEEVAAAGDAWDDGSDWDASADSAYPSADQEQDMIDAMQEEMEAATHHAAAGMGEADVGAAVAYGEAQDAAEEAAAEAAAAEVARVEAARLEVQREEAAQRRLLEEQAEAAAAAAALLGAAEAEGGDAEDGGGEGNAEEDADFLEARKRAEARRAAEEAEAEAARLAEEKRQNMGAPVEKEAPKTVFEFYRPKPAEPVYPGGFYKRETRWNQRKPAGPTPPNRF